ncbi:MAG: hypothetical protein JXO48_02050 [Deltaproteobacteria bacterium]|nr:hypothetical protein [Deltaproteobacteria bacterium]
MKLDDIITILEGRVLTRTGTNDLEIQSCGSADLMSDVLAFQTEESGLLLTGLTNQQVIRTAEMANINAIVFVRGKIPPQSTIDLAEELSIPLISCFHSMYKASGLLYNAGLPDNGVVSIPCR